VKSPEPDAVDHPSDYAKAQGKFDWRPEDIEVLESEESDDDDEEEAT
jgi:hypothetical protein